jgi:hypothetical protein
VLIDNIDFSKKYNYTLILTKKSKQPIGILKESYNRNLERNLETLDKLSFTVPKYIENSITHEKELNPNYDKIIVENMILLKCGDMSNPIEESYFIIKNVSENTEKEVKQVECSSRQVSLNKNTMTFNGLERQLNKDELNIADGIFDILEQETTWKLGHIDDSARVENINGSVLNKYRWFDASDKPIFQFLSEDVSQAFNVIVKYDTVNKLINVYDRNNYGSHTGLILSEQNYIKDLNKKTNSESVVTKLICTGRDELTFNDINILGTDYILDYHYFINNGQMSTELISALSKYDILLNTKNTEFQNLQTSINTLNSQLVIKNSELTTLEEQLKALKILQAQYISANDNVNLTQATTNVNNKESEITNNKSEISNLQSQINNINSQISQIAITINKKTAVDSNGVLIFNSDLLDELEDFTYTEKWPSNYYANSTQLLNAAKKELDKLSIPTIEFEISSIDLFGLAETQNYWDKLNLGDFVRVYSKILNDNLDVRIISYSYNIDGNDLKFTFSNKNFKMEDLRNISESIRKATDGSKIVNTKKLSWNQIKDTTTAFNDYYNNALDVAKQNIIAMQGRNKFDMTENGIFVMDSENENNQLIMTAGQIAITNDGLQTVRTAINSQGVIAEEVVGRLFIGQELYIQNNYNTFKVDNNGVKISNNNSDFLFDESGFRIGRQGVGTILMQPNLETIYDGTGTARVRLGNYATGKYGLQVISSTGESLIDGDLITSNKLQGDTIDCLGILQMKAPFGNWGAGAAEIRFFKQIGGYDTIKMGGSTGYTNIINISSGLRVEGTINAVFGKFDGRMTCNDITCYNPPWAGIYHSHSEYASSGHYHSEFDSIGNFLTNLDGRVMALENA